MMEPKIKVLIVEDSVVMCRVLQRILSNDSEIEVVGIARCCEDAFSSAKELKPDYEYSYLNLSALYIDKKEYQKAIDILSEGIVFNKEAYDLYYNRACSYAIINEFENALDDIELALKLYPPLIEWIVWDDDFFLLRDKDRYLEIIKNYT